MRYPNAGLDVLLKGCPHLSLGVGMVTRKGLLTAPKCVTAAGYHPNLINTHIYKIGEVKQRTTLYYKVLFSGQKQIGGR